MWEIHDKPSVFPIEDQFLPQWNNAIGLKLYGFEVIGENKSSEMQTGGGDHLPQKSCQLNKLKFNLVNECYCNDPVLIPVALRWLGISPTLHFPRVRLPRRVEWWMKWACGRFTGLVGSPCLFRRPGPVEGWHTWFNIVLKCIWIFFWGVLSIFKELRGARIDPKNLSSGNGANVLDALWNETVVFPHNVVQKLAHMTHPIATFLPSST